MVYQQPPNYERNKAQHQAIKELLSRIEDLAAYVEKHMGVDLERHLRTNSEELQSAEKLADAINKLHYELCVFVWDSNLPRGEREHEGWSMHFAYKRLYEHLQSEFKGFNAPALFSNIMKELADYSSVYENASWTSWQDVVDLLKTIEGYDVACVLAMAYQDDLWPKGQKCFKTKKLQIRITGSTLEFSSRETFDQWKNSRICCINVDHLDDVEGAIHHCVQMCE